MGETLEEGYVYSLRDRWFNGNLLDDSTSLYRIKRIKSRLHKRGVISVICREPKAGIVERHGFSVVEFATGKPYPMYLVNDWSPSCDLCGGSMVREAVCGDSVFWYCKDNPNPSGPTRVLSPEMKKQRRHHDKSCVILPYGFVGDGC